MEKTKAVSFFLGANSPGGFRSLYDGFTDPERDRLFILKGGPGCGKSTFMRAMGRAAEEAGLRVEYIRCSGDPDSLDGVYVPERRTGYVDGTSPHVIEPAYAGSEGVYVNMGALYDLGALRERRGEIEYLTRAYKARYARAFKLLTGAAALSGGVKLPEEAVLAAVRRVKGVIHREIKGAGEGRTVKRFLSAYTCRGRMCLWETVEALSGRVYVLDNDLGLGTVCVEAAASAARERGIDAIRCQSPMFPEVTEHLILPGLGVALVTQTEQARYAGEAYRHLRLDSIPDKETRAALRPELRRRAKLRERIIGEVTAELAEAKRLHDELEAVYIPNVDFAGADRLAQRHIDSLLNRT